jgi:hypothetical protein
MRLFRNLLKNWMPSPAPAVQGPLGPSGERECFAPPEPGIIERFAGYWRGHPIYIEQAPRPIWIRSERAIANEKLAAERRMARGGDGPIRVVDDPLPGASWRQPGRGPYQASDL